MRVYAIESRIHLYCRDICDFRGVFMKDNVEYMEHYYSDVNMNEE